MKKCKLPEKHLGPHELVDINDWPTAHYRTPYDDREDDHLCHVSEGFENRWRERVACPGCGDVAIREVHRLRSGEIHVPYCGICNDLSRADHYARLSAQFQRRAAEKRAKKTAREQS